MNKVSLIILSFVFIYGCKNKNLANSSNGYRDSITPVANNIDSAKNTAPIQVEKENAQSEIVPDTTINDKLKLNNYGSIEFFTKDYKYVKTIDRIRESPVAAFTNSNDTEYLLASQYEGSTKNSYSLFEIGYVKDAKLKIAFNNVDEKTFQTESGIHLGMSLKDLIQLKGNDYKIVAQKDTVVTYRINDYNKSKFLKKYSMPGYFIECHIKNSQISNFIFGFDYP